MPKKTAAKPAKKKEAAAAPAILAPVVAPTTTTNLVAPATTDDTGVNSRTAFQLFGPRADAPKPKKGEVVLSRLARLKALKENINKQFKGRALIREGSEITNTFILRRPTGITTLDVALGGGFPAGGLVQVIGRDSSGKSYLANRVMAVAQETYKNDFAACVCMTEMRFDKAFAKGKCGLRVAYSEEEIEIFERINARYGYPPFSAEYLSWLRDGMGTFMEVIAPTAEEVLEIAVQKIESNLFQVVLIDSFGALLTKAEAEAEEGLEQKYRGGASNVITAFMHRLHAALSLPDKDGRPNTTTVIGINQYRDNVGKDSQYQPLKIAGGWALRHGKLIDLLLEAGPKLRLEKAQDYAVYGKEIRWEITKGKAGCHDGPKGEYRFYFGEFGYGFGVDVFSDLLVAGVQAGAIEQNGAYFYFNGSTIGQGAEAAARSLWADPALGQAVRHTIFQKKQLNIITNEWAA